MEPLTVGSVQQAIEKVTTGSSATAQWLDKKGLRLRQAKDPSDWPTILGYYNLSDSVIDGTQSNQNSADDATTHPTILESTFPMRFGIMSQKSIHNHDDQLCGMVTFYIGYSTWDGRILYVDRLVTSGNSEERDMTEMCLLTTLAGIATSLNCTRLTWTHKETPSWYSEGQNPPKTLHDWLSLSMERKAIEKFTSEYAIPTRTIEENGGGGDFNSGGVVNLLVTDCLLSLNQCFEDSDSKWRLRLAKVDDVDSIVRLVHGLAIYEKEPDAVHMTAEKFRLDGFSTDRPLFHCLLLDYHGREVDASIPNNGVHTCGMAFFYFGYRLDEGRFLYLEDLFIEEDYRKFGGGKLAMQALGRISQIVQCNRMVWQALDWNTPALDFYRKIGAKVEEGLLTTRFSGSALVDFSIE